MDLGDTGKIVHTRVAVLYRRGPEYLQDLNLRYLYEAAKLGSMRAAADSLGVAVSSVSRQISQLEAEIGLALIEHGRRNIKLTETGQLLIEHYSDQLRLYEAFEAKLSDIKGLRTGRILLAVGEGFIGQPLSNMLVRFNAKHPGLFINLHMAASSNETLNPCTKTNVRFPSARLLAATSSRMADKLTDSACSVPSPRANAR